MVQERTKQELQLQKAESAELKKAAQLYKLKIAEEKRVAREAANKVKKKEQAEQTAERARQKEAQNAKKALQLSRKDKRPASRPPKRVIKRQKQMVDAVDGKVVVEAASAALTVTTRRGRDVNPPSKFK